MTVYGMSPSSVGLDHHGIVDPGDVYWNLSSAELYEHALRNGEGSVSQHGALVCTTGAHTAVHRHEATDLLGNSRQLMRRHRGCRPAGVCVAPYG